MHGVAGLSVAVIHGAPVSMVRSFMRSAVWERIDLLALLKSHGTASPRCSKNRSTARKNLAIGIPLKTSQLGGIRDQGFQVGE